MTYNYVFKFENRNLEIVTDTIPDALEYLRFREPRLNFGHLVYFISMKTGERTPVYEKRKIYLDEVNKLSNITV